MTRASAEDARRPQRALQELEGARGGRGGAGHPEGRAGARRHLVVHLAGRDAAGQQRGDEGAAADADVEVEVEDAAVEELLEGAQAADLVDGPGDAAAGADEGHLLGASATADTVSPRIFPTRAPPM